ncbi:tyrosine-type recombinase/integrase [Roseiconus lacunae]|uniref:tyrosine-type recombinase/integrase n=1 Tax=Roseiconus lacunae TaxID=2605694 RepID=UPI001E62AA20|nr:tyrosine-type recombinase/integrase [Roseiconus lacunae]MCD0459160.1 site-specific integrase [Roseiconus lacunae]
MRKPVFLKSKKIWVVRVPKPDGGLRQITLGETKKKAYEKWRLMTDSDGSVIARSPTVVKLIGIYLEWLKGQAALGHVEQKTIRSKLVRILPFCKWIERNHPGRVVSQLKPHHVTDWLGTRERWGATTRYDAVADLKRVFNWAVSEGRIEKNPIAVMKIRKGPPRDYVVDRPEYERLFQESGGSKFAGRHCRTFRPVLIALWQSGCRPSEIRRVTLKDFDGKRWKIKNHKNRKKVKRARVVHLSPCLQTLSKILSYGRDSGPLFQPQANERWTYEKMKQRFDRSRKKAKANEKCIMYAFRHSWITRAMLSGLDAGTVAAMTGTSIRMIDEHYGHLSRFESHLEEAARKVVRAAS